MNSAVESVKKILLTMLLALGVGAIIILVIGQNPIEAYAALIKGAFVGKRAFGTTLASLTPLLLTTVAFALAAKAAKAIVVDSLFRRRNCCRSCLGFYSGDTEGFIQCK